MKYILDSSGYVESASCNPISCDDKVSQEYKGSIPSGYSSLDEWILNANIRAYKITSGNLVYDSARDAALQAEWAKTPHFNAYSTTETVIGTWIDGKPLYRRVYDVGAMPAANAYKSVALYINNLDTVTNLRGIMHRPSDNYRFVIPYSEVNIYMDNNDKFTIHSTVNRSAFNGIVIIEYTKTTD